MDEINNITVLKPDCPKDLLGKTVTISASEYYLLLNESSLLTHLKNALGERQISYSIGNYKERNYEEVLQRLDEDKEDIPDHEPKFKPGDPVTFGFMFGEGSRYDGEPRLAFVKKVEYIEAHNSYLYHLTMPTKYTSNCLIGHVVVGEHLVFGYNEDEKCKQAIEKLKGEYKRDHGQN